MKGVAWKPQAYKQAARTIESYPEDIEALYKKRGLKGLQDISDVGEGIAKKIAQFIKTGKVKELQRLRKQVPLHISVLMKIPSMGPKKVKKLMELLNIKTIEQLKKAAKQHKIAKISGFGPKSEQDILEGIELFKGAKGRIPLKQAQKQAEAIVLKLKKSRAVKKIAIAGSLRRQKTTIGDLDILVSSKHPNKIIDTFTKIKGIKKVLGKGPTKASIILKTGTQADLRVIEDNSWGAGLLYFTGSKNYGIGLRKIAIKKGWKLNEYGLYDKQTNKMLAGKTEKEILKKLQVPYLTPRQREK